MKKLTTEEFIAKATLAHNGKFSYTNAVYVNSNTKVEIICPNHGSFFQNPVSHASGIGCAKCAVDGQTLTTETFIEKCKAIHGLRYDYSETIYEHNTIDVKIICKIHGPFLQKPRIHTTGSGCQICAVEQSKKSTEKFIEEAIAVHGSTYCYDEVDYLGADIDIKIICKIHGPFLQPPRSHTNGYGCKKCAIDSHRLTTNIFIERATAIRGTNYCYDETKYIDYFTPVEIKCQRHGKFLVSPANHLNGSKCESCIEDHKIAKFIDEARHVHGDKYDYSNTTFINTATKLSIMCKEPGHGAFFQLPGLHTRGSGCPKCAGVAQYNSETFIKKAKEIHGNKYIYDKTIYKNHKTNVIIECRIHGEFTQRAGSHFSHGCSHCSHDMRRYSTMAFIEKAISIYGDTKYSYENVDYKNIHTKVEVICQLHGPFMVTPHNHICGKKSGCPSCSGMNKVREEFVERAQNYHGMAYCYDEVDYQGATVKVKIGCNTCKKSFWQLPYNHLNGNGCSFCAGTAKPSTLEYIEKAKEVHGTKYIYDEVEYVNTATKIKVICPIEGHGAYYVSPPNHLKTNCPSCAGTKQLTTEDFIERSTKIHGDHYDYSLVEYTNNAEKVDIICRIHNMQFKQVASSHLKGYSGCRLCDQNGFNYDKPCTVYYIKFECEDRLLYKIGITTTRVQTRISGMKVHENIKITILQETKYENGHLALAKEKLTKFKEFQYTGENIMNNGNTELFIKDVLGLDK